MNIECTDYILEIPEDTVFSNLSPGLQLYINSLGAEWPDMPAIGTHAVNGRGLIQPRLQKSLNKEQLETLFNAYSLDWKVLFIRSAYPINPAVIGQDQNGNDIVEMQYITILSADKSILLPYIDPIVIGYDANEMPITRPAEMTDTIYLSMYAGTDPLKL